MSVYKQPHETHERWLREGQSTIDSANKKYFSSNATEEDGAHEVYRLIAYYLISQGEDAERIFSEAMERAREDWDTAHELMEKEEKRW